MVDLGCWPGGWLQVAAEAVGSEGRVVGVDLAALAPPLDLANVFAIQGDLSEARVLEEVLAQLGGPAEVLLSDAAAKLTGVRATDRAREEALLAAIEAALPRLLARRTLLVKLPTALRRRAREADPAASTRARAAPEASRKGRASATCSRRGGASRPAGCSLECGGV